MALLLGGNGTWRGELDSLEKILAEHQVPSAEIYPSDLESMTLDQLSQYRLIIIPGGDGPTITSQLSARSHAKIREAVQVRGMSYLGFCAGAWIAVAPAPLPGQDVSYGLGVVSGPVQEQTSMFKKGLHFALVRAPLWDGSVRDLLWWGGPITPEVPGGVLARYEDGTPAITQLRSGQGFVILSGLHPAAGREVTDSLGLEPREGNSLDYAWQLLEAALSQVPIAPHLPKNGFNLAIGATP